MNGDRTVQQAYAAGALICGEGEISDRVGRLLAGEIEVSKRHAGQEIAIGTIRSGEFFGEMGVLEGRPRSATLRAIGAVSVEYMSPEQFLRRVSADPALALDLLVRMSRRLRYADTALTAAVLGVEVSSPAPETASEAGAMPSLRLCADSERIGGLLPVEGHRISSLPFFFGRVPTGEESQPPLGIDFTVVETTPSRLATVHFAIVRDDGGVAIKDFGTEFGTIVDGVLLGGDIGRQTLKLPPGVHRIVAGGEGSHFAFQLHIDD